MSFNHTSTYYIHTYILVHAYLLTYVHMYLIAYQLHCLSVKPYSHTLTRPYILIRCIQSHWNEHFLIYVLRINLFFSFFLHYTSHNIRHPPSATQTPASGYPGAIDDLIFSGAGSGCRGDDEDECTPPFESGSGDDLITPVYVPPTKQTTTAQNANTDKQQTNGTERACDDEDCLHGSGDYGETTEQFTSTSTARGSGKSFWCCFWVAKYLS